MATKKTTTPAAAVEEQPFDLLAVLDRPGDSPTRPATLGEITVHVQTSWVGAEVAAVSTAMAGGLEGVIHALIPDEAEADAAWELIGNMRQDVALLVVQKMLEFSGLVVDGVFLGRSEPSEADEDGDEQ